MAGAEPAAESAAAREGGRGRPSREALQWAAAQAANPCDAVAALLGPPPRGPAPAAAPPATPGPAAAGAAEASAPAASTATPSAATAAAGVEEVEAGSLSAWPAHYVPIRRLPFSFLEELIAVMKPQSADGVPLIIEGTGVMDPAKWADLSLLTRLLHGQQLLVKRSRGNKFRYFDIKKNTGNYDFSRPVEESKRTLEDFVSESARLLEEGRPERMYLQETLSGHAEMAEEFATWRWELLIRVSTACGWGLPDSNELFVGMRGAETPLHFDERENLFFQVRGRKELVTFPFVDYCRLYPFPTTHPCDRQSMVGSPRTPDLEAFPRFADAVGHYGTLRAGDLLYLPYGWWHWLRNVDHLAVSVSFWSTTPPSDLSQGIPDVFSDHMLTRARRNLESMIASQHGPENHNCIMLRLRQAILDKEKQDPHLAQVRKILAFVQLAPAAQDEFLLETIEGRFGVDWNAYVEG